MKVALFPKLKILLRDILEVKFDLPKFGSKVGDRDNMELEEK